MSYYNKAIYKVVSEFLECAPGPVVYDSSGAAEYALCLSPAHAQCMYLNSCEIASLLTMRLEKIWPEEDYRDTDRRGAVSIQAGEIKWDTRHHREVIKYKPTYGEWKEGWPD